MNYLITGKLSAREILRLPHEEFVQLVHSRYVPSFQMLIEAMNQGKLLAGGIPVGSRDCVLIVNLATQDSHRVVRQFLVGLPVFDLYDWQVTPLETFPEAMQGFKGS